MIKIKTTNDKQNATQKSKDRAACTSLKTERTRVLLKGRQFLLQMWHPPCYSCYKPGDKHGEERGDIILYVYFTRIKKSPGKRGLELWFNAISNNISVISWRSVLLVEKTNSPGKKILIYDSYFKRDIIYVDYVWSVPLSPLHTFQTSSLYYICMSLLKYKSQINLFPVNG